MALSTTRSKELFARACKIIPGGVNSPVRAFKSVGGTPIYFRSAAGSRFTDVDGNEFVDLCQSWGPLILGHAHPAVVEAVCRAAEKGLSYGACHEREIELASLVLEAFSDFSMVRFVSSGTEAVMTALRLARGVTGRDLVVKFEGGYHGHVDSMLVQAGSGLVTAGVASSSGVPGPVAGTTIVARFDDEEGIEKIFSEHGNAIAAVIIEPLPANNGLLIQRPEFLSKLRSLTKKHGSLLIFDEVISGFRLRFGGYYQEVGITPDLVTLGKIIGGGMPVGAVVGSTSIMENLAPVGSVYQSGTLSGNPVALAAGIATLSVLKTEQPYAALSEKADLFEKTLTSCGCPIARVVRAGSILWLYLCEGEIPRAAAAIDQQAVRKFNGMYWDLIAEGWYVPPSAFEVMFVSAAHTSAEIEEFAKAVIRHVT